MFRFNDAGLTNHEVLKRVAAPWHGEAQLSRLTQNPRKAHEKFQFAVLGDAEPGRFWLFRTLFNRPGVFKSQLAAIQEQSIDFSIQLGDMVSRGLPHHYMRFFDELNSVGVRKPYLTVIGNHDRFHPHGSNDATMYSTLFGRRNYHFDYGGVRFIVLDSSRARVTESQLRWLRLVAKTPLRKLVFTHMPPTMLKLWGGAAAHEMGGFKSGAPEFTDLMARMEVERVYMGHVHCFGVQDYKGVRYVLTGGGGSPLFPCGSSDKFHHYLTVTVEPGGVSERVHALDGQSFQIPRGKVLLA